MDFTTLGGREADYYIALVGEFFDRLDEGYDDASGWAYLGRSLTQSAELLAASNPSESFDGVSAEPWLLSSTAFFLGGYSASAYLTMRRVSPAQLDEAGLACFELLTRNGSVRSIEAQQLVGALRVGRPDLIEQLAATCAESARRSLASGPELWVTRTLLARLVSELARTNLRAVLPNGFSDVWNPLVASFLDRARPVWDYFPSQIEAIDDGLLHPSKGIALQMPTGAGKTALTETLLFHHLTTGPESNLAVLLVPYRSIAAELRQSVARRLSQMGLSTLCVYGGTIPTQDEVQDLDTVRAIIATPESFMGVLAAEPSLADRVSLVVCDEGHLIDGGSRGVALELLLARLRRSGGESRRFVFMSAIVPNVEEISAWLGGDSAGVIRSSFMPAPTEFARLDSRGSGAGRIVDIRVNPGSEEPRAFTLEGILEADDFRFLNQETGRSNLYQFGSINTQTVAVARKALAMGSVAVFAANKNGAQGVVGLAGELLKQIGRGLSLPLPLASVGDSVRLQTAVEYMQREFGNSWVGTAALRVGAVVHHGDLPQETRELAEDLLRDRVVPLAFCTSTLAEGVNLPIRTLLLYSVQRSDSEGNRTPLLTREIRNLVGRAGRPGETTRGLVIGCNPNQWPQIAEVAAEVPNEQLEGTLARYMRRLLVIVAERGAPLSNAALEATPDLLTLVDGIDFTLLELAADEIDRDELVGIAREVSEWTFAHRRGSDQANQLLGDVFELRATRIAELRDSGRLYWVRRSGLSPRMADSVESELLDKWDWQSELTSPTDPDFIAVLVRWAWPRPEMLSARRDSPALSEDLMVKLVADWIAGLSRVEIASRRDIEIDQLLRLLSGPVLHTFHQLVDQALAAITEIIETIDFVVASSIQLFPQNLRFGVPSESARILSVLGVRHRSACVQLGTEIGLRFEPMGPAETAEAALGVISSDGWSARLGELVRARTVQDLAGITVG